MHANKGCFRPKIEVKRVYRLIRHSSDAGDKLVLSLPPLVMLDLGGARGQLSRLQLVISATTKKLACGKTHGQLVLALRLFGKYLKLVAMDPLCTFPRNRQELPNGRL